MNVFRGMLGLLWLGLAVYTAITVANHGASLFNDFLGDLMEMGWPGQFNADFSCFLILNCTWMMWRFEFSPGGIALGLTMGLFGGAFFLFPFLIYLTMRSDGDIVAAIIGENRLRALQG